MWEKRASFTDEETASCTVLPSLYLKQEGRSSNGRPPARSASPGAWGREFTGGGKCEPPSGKKRQQAAVCLPASI